MPGILLSVDFEKVFESLIWNFIYETLEMVHFGKNVYNGIKSTVLNNENTDKFFK